MPTPNAGEQQDDFIGRCMADSEAKDSFPEADQRAAFCHAQWERKDQEGTPEPPPDDKSKARAMPLSPQWQRATLAPGGNVLGVDRAKNAILGYVVAQEGPFKTDGRGEFDLASLRTIKRLMDAEPRGLKSRFTHPDMSSDGLGKFLGRSRNARMDKKMVPLEGGTFKQISLVRADLYFDPTAFDTPHGNLAKYCLDLAESDPDALASSLVLQKDEEFRIDEKGIALTGADGEDLPPLWRPTRLHASDLVDEGEAVDGLLSAELSFEGLPDGAVRKGAELLDRQFAGQSREVVTVRCTAWLSRYLDRRFGPGAAPVKLNPTVGSLVAGDLVQWIVADEVGSCACLCQGMIEAVSDTGPLEIPGTGLSLDGAPDDPVARVRVDLDDDGDYDDQPADGILAPPLPGTCWYLVPFSRLTKVVIQPSGREQTSGRLAISAEDEALALEIESMSRRRD